MAELSPQILQQQGLIEALGWWGGQIKAKHGLEVTVNVEGTMERLTPDVEASVFQAVKELLQNTLKYAHAEQATIRIICSPTRLEIQVADDGVGFDPSLVETTEKGGFGLFSVHERMAYLGGDFQIDSAPGKGTRSTLSLPLPCDEPGK
jgi:two-component system sensor histidine kinase DegS